MFRSSLAVAAGFLALTFTPGAAQAAIVNVGGTNYDVTYFTGAANSNLSKFNTPANGGQMPWWGNSSLAQSFATAVGNQAGLPNLAGDGGPFFAFAPEPGFPRFESWSIDQGIVKKEFWGANVTINSWATASLAPPPAPSGVPGPLPLFGAAAAFSMSRRLRRRIQLVG